MGIDIRFCNSGAETFDIRGSDEEIDRFLPRDDDLLRLDARKRTTDDAAEPLESAIGDEDDRLLRYE